MKRRRLRREGLTDLYWNPHGRSRTWSLSAGDGIRRIGRVAGTKAGSGGTFWNKGIWGKRGGREGAKTGG